MKNLLKFLGIIAIVALIGFVAACSDDDDPVITPTPKTSTYISEANGSKYTLTITENLSAKAISRATYIPRTDDSYTLVVTEISSGTIIGTSNGTVQNANGSNLTLKPSYQGAENFTVIISSDNMIRIEGTITFITGNTQEAPGDVFPEIDNSIIIPITSAEFSSEAGNNILTITLNGGKYAQNFNYDSFSITSGNGGFVSLGTEGSGVPNNAFRLNDTTVILFGLDPVTTAGTGQKITIAAKALERNPTSATVTASTLVPNTANLSGTITFNNLPANFDDIKISARGRSSSNRYINYSTSSTWWSDVSLNGGTGTWTIELNEMFLHILEKSGNTGVDVVFFGYFWNGNPVIASYTVTKTVNEENVNGTNLNLGTVTLTDPQ